MANAEVVQYRGISAAALLQIPALFASNEKAARYTFTRIGAVINIRAEDVYVQEGRTWLRLHEKGGKRHEMPAHHVLDQYLD